MIKKILFENFQCFRERTILELSPLSLMYGPNSSGKSAVEDALRILNESLSIAVSNRNWDALDPLVASSFRRELAGDAIDRSKNMQVGAESRCHARVGGDADELFPIDQPHDVYIEVGIFYDDKFEDHEYYRFNDWVIELDGADWFRMECGESVSLNLNHKYLIGSRIAQLAAAGIDVLPEIVSQDGDWITIVSDSAYFSNELSLATDLGLTPDSIPESVSGAAKEFLIAVGAYIDDSVRMAMGNTHFIYSLAPASRRIPESDDLVYEFWYDSYGDGDSLSFHPLRKFRKPIVGDSLLLEIAKSALSEFRELEDDSSDFSNTLAIVNRIISEQLFPGSGYRLSYEVVGLIPHQAMREFATTNIIFDSHGEFQGFLVRLFMVDGSGKEVALKDIGSGFAYLLPVLCVLNAPNFAEEISIIQQPELHVHPAVQSKLGDVFCQVYQSRQLIIETHSEHILLRILRRVRQGATNVIDIYGSLPIDAHDVVIHYFEPVADGCTRVRKIRISEGGEFLDRWPQGFFEERYEDLFDE